MIRLKALRKRKGVNQSVVADYIGVSFQTYSRYEKGISRPKRDILNKLADFFDVPVDYIQSQLPLIIDDNESRRLQDDLLNKFNDQFNKNIITNHLISIPIYKRIPFSFDFVRPDSSLINERNYKLDVPFYYLEADKPLFCFIFNEDFPNTFCLQNDIIIARKEFKVKDGDFVVVNINQKDATIMQLRVVNQKPYLYSLSKDQDPIEFISNANLKYVGLVLETKRVFVQLDYPVFIV